MKILFSMSTLIFDFSGHEVSTKFRGIFPYESPGQTKSINFKLVNDTFIGAEIMNIRCKPMPLFLPVKRILSNTRLFPMP
jgi:hypothetical protein